MSNRFKIIKVTPNSIDVEWEISSCSNQATSRSPPFALTSDNYPASFYVQVWGNPNINIHIHNSTPGRAIVKIALQSSGNSHTIVTFIKNWKDLIKFKDIKNVLQSENDKLKIVCNIIWLGGTAENDQPRRHPSPLSIKNVPFDNNRSPDFHINIGSQRLAAHKAILARHSEVLAAMFEVSMKEARENEITIKNIEYPVMEIVLKIIYTGLTEDLNDIDTALKVLQASEQYQMPIVKAACEYALQMKIQDDNVLRLLDEADMHRASKLCHTCVEYIVAKNDQILTRDKLEEMADERPTIKAALGDLGCSFARLLTYQAM